jgi:HEPN domain-containing protein
MNSFEEGRAYIDDAWIILAEAEESVEKGHFHRAVRKCQESVELALKGLLRMYGVEYPKRHLFASILQRSPLVQLVDPDELNAIIEIADRLAEEREVSFYGSGQAAASQLFSDADARESISDGKKVLEFVRRLVPKPAEGR